MDLLSYPAVLMGTFDIALKGAWGQVKMIILLVPLNVIVLRHWGSDRRPSTLGTATSKSYRVGRGPCPPQDLKNGKSLRLSCWVNNYRT